MVMAGEEHLLWEEEKPTKTQMSLRITEKKAEYKSEEKRLEDLPIVWDFSEVFPEDLPGLPPTRQRFMEGFLKIAKPMTNLTKNNVKFEWGEKEEAAFQLLEQKLCSAPILSLPEGSENFMVYCDASHKGLDAVLMPKEKVIAYVSRQLKVNEKNYMTHNLEDSRFTSHFWQSLQKSLGTQLDMSMAYHPQTDNQSERIIQMLDDMLHACVIDFGNSQDRHLPLVEFSYNNSYHTSIKAAPFEIKNRIQGARDRQKSYADVRRKPLKFQVGDKATLKVSPWKGVLHFGKQRKLNPRYIRPFKVLAKVDM
ncbi:putative reverse transcriptase domain-containing protein [Tanacetum coccineum]